MLDEIFARNKRWSAGKVREDPDYFKSLSVSQTPDYLWIGCSDSRVPANVITGLQPGEVFVHCNVANLIHPADLNMLSVVEFAVQQLRVKHIIICGHHGCGGIRAAVSGKRLGLIDHWLQPIRNVAAAQFSDHERDDWTNRDLDRLCESSVVEQVRRLARTPILQDAWKAGAEVAIHGWVYGLEDGLLSDLSCTRTGPSGTAAGSATRII